MRKNFGVKPAIYPMPVLSLGSYDENGVPDAMNAAWGGITGSDEITMSISAGHKSTANILARKCFTVSMADAAHMAACDYVGLESANKTPNKLEKAGLHTTKAEFVDAPLIDELPMALECELVSYDAATARMIGKIINVSADERVLNEAGNVDPDKMVLITFDPMNNTYRKLGEVVGTAFHDGLALK